MLVYHVFWKKARKIKHLCIKNIDRKVDMLYNVYMSKY